MVDVRKDAQKLAVDVPHGLSKVLREIAPWRKGEHEGYMGLADVRGH